MRIDHVTSGEARVLCSEWATLVERSQVVFPPTGGLFDVRRQDGSRAAVFHVEYMPVLSMAFDDSKSGIATYRTFDFVRKSVADTLTHNPIVFVDHASPLLPYADRMMKPIPCRAFRLKVR